MPKRQVNLTIDDEYVCQLQRIARETAATENRPMTLTGLIVETLMLRFPKDGDTAKSVNS